MPESVTNYAVLLKVGDVDGQQVDLAYQWLIDDAILDDAAEANLAAATIGKGRGLPAC